MKNTLKFKNGPAGAELYLYGSIGFWGISAEGFAMSLQGLNGADLTLRINSPGGEISDGMAICNLLKSYAGKVTARIDGMAASIASVIAMGAREVIMGEGSMMMVHMPLVQCADGNAAELRKLADDLDKFESSIVEVYTARTKKSAEEIRAIMASETYLTAEECVSLGFADSVAKLDGASLGNAPMNFFNAYKNAQPVAKAFEAAKVDFTPEAFSALVAKAQKADEAEALIADAIAKAGADIDAAKAEAVAAADKLTAAQAALDKANADHATATAAAAEASNKAVLEAHATAGRKAADLAASIGLSKPIVNSSAATVAHADCKAEYQRLLSTNPGEATKFYNANKAAITSKQ